MARRRFRSLLLLLLGISLGLWLGSGLRSCDLYPSSPPVGYAAPLLQTTFTRSSHRRLFIGVMTAKRYLPTRVVAAYETWARSLPGTVIFFSSEGSSLETHRHIPIVSLAGVDDSYPPQKKSFLMLKYMHDHFLDQYEWFMRVDDDVYIKGDRLRQFINSVNSSKTQFIGQAGLGNREEFGQLSLDSGQNFCMGGPGIIFSRSTLQKVVPNISYCLKNLYTSHEDVEVGRCTHKFAGVTCTWAFEMQHLFYQNHKDPNGSFRHSLKSKEVLRAITLHPIKNHSHQYKLHTFLLSRKSMDFRQKLLRLRRELYMMKILTGADDQDKDVLGQPPSLTRYRPESRNDVIAWDFLSRHIYSAANLNPKQGRGMPLDSALKDVVSQVMRLINKNARQRGRTIDFRDILYGYRRLDPLRGADHVLDLLLVYRRHKGRKMTVPVRRHAYLQQTFTALEVSEDGESLRADAAPEAHNGMLTALRARFSGFLKAVPPTPAPSEPMTSQAIHFIMPLYGRAPQFLHFIERFEKVYLQFNENVHLLVILYRSPQESGDDVIKSIDELNKRYPGHRLQVELMAGSFARAAALSRGAELCSNTDLLFLIDVDIHVSREVLGRIRTNTVLGAQIYAPIVFSQYDPHAVCANASKSCLRRQGTGRQDSSLRGDVTDDAGYWRNFGFGIVSVYAADLAAAGGFDVNIQGWGKEDVALYQAFLIANYTVFRAPDPDLIHVFHPVLCDLGLEPAQYRMCLGSRAASYGSQRQLAEYVYSNPSILEKEDNASPGPAKEDLNVVGAHHLGDT